MNEKGKLYLFPISKGRKISKSHQHFDRPHSAIVDREYILYKLSRTLFL